ncbi:MAG TPA: P63C domain-containing protein [Salinarimonas sp.]|nr:P63C domain-containing protein [Salinarimonas sp.]
MTDDKPKPSPDRAAGGHARAKALSPERRREIAKKAAGTRWAGVLQATHEGKFPIAGTEMHAYVLPNGKRILAQGTFLQAIGRVRTPKAGTGALSADVDELPFFLQAEALQPFISAELRASTKPYFFTTMAGREMVGWDAELLPMVCDVYLKLRDQSLADKGVVPKRYESIITACDLLVRGLARVGIIALVDEATGYQYDRARTALAEILEAFISKELARWVKTFPDDYYENIYRIRKWKQSPLQGRRPQIVGKWTSDIVYARLAPGVLDRLREVTPRDDKGRFKNKLFQRLTPDYGVPALREHLASVVTLLKLTKEGEWAWFMSKMDHMHPKYTPQLLLPGIPEPTRGD